MNDFNSARRRYLFAAGATASGLLLSCPPVRADEKDGQHDDGREKDVGAVEDLMREHGIIRRALLVYRECAAKLRAKPGSVDPETLRRTAVLFRRFAEDYHEQKLEEAYIFPILKQADGPVSPYIDVLIAQHQRGREITDYILAATGKGSVGTGVVDPLAKVLDSVELMYANHAAREDTIIFPAWKDALSADRFEELGEKFEEIEHQEFGKDGFEDAVAEIGRIELMLGLAELAQFTAPSPPNP